jgi:hypothetical protein
MSNETVGSDEKSLRGLDGERSLLARRLVTNAMAVIWALIAGLVIMAVAPLFNSQLAVGSQYQTAFDKILTGILPLLGAWIGAVIAFYFGCENYEARHVTFARSWASTATPGSKVSTSTT